MNTCDLNTSVILTVLDMLSFKIGNIKGSCLFREIFYAYVGLYSNNHNYYISDV